jgi:hypothetical protein
LNFGFGRWSARSIDKLTKNRLSSAHKIYFSSNTYRVSWSVFIYLRHVRV